MPDQEPTVEAASSRLTSHTSAPTEQRLEAAATFSAPTEQRLEAAATFSAPAEQRLEAAAAFFNPYEETKIFRANLPHWRQDSKLYFITFRLADSLPQEKLARLQAERESWMLIHPPPLSENDEREYWHRFGGRIQQFLDADHGSCILAQPDLALIVDKAMQHFDSRRYELGERVVAANHVHALVRPLPGHELSNILHSWKSFTANAINLIVEREGPLWQKESYDHLVRNTQAQWNIEHYIRSHKSSISNQK